jgi:hypothetical protein
LATSVENATTASFLSSAAHLPGLVGSETKGLLANVRRSRRVLWTLTMIECRRKYAGSILGMLWYPLYSMLLHGLPLLAEG